MAAHITGSIFSTGLILQRRYRLDDPLASGGMAELWRGHDLTLQRPVAIKLLHPHLAGDPKLVERFRREAVAAAGLSHPHIVPTYDAGTDAGATYIILGLIHGPTLADVMATNRFEPMAAVSIARQIADALDHAHRAGIVHRDVKPSNVLIVDNDNRVMVADFGIAKAVADSSDESLTLPGLVVGTPEYLAPEQAEGRSADARSDIYATGVVLHEMLCGHTSAVAGASAHDAPTVLTAVVDDHGNPSTVCPNLPDGVRQIVAKATQHDPEHRYQSALELCTELTQAERSLQQRAQRVSGPIKMPITPPGGAATKQPIAKWSNGEETREHRTVDITTTGANTASTPSNNSRQPVPKRNAGNADDERPYLIEQPPSGRRRRVGVIVCVVLLIAAAILTGRWAAGGGDDAKDSPTATTISLSTVAAFDPLGDSKENNAQLNALIDNNPSTTWSTERYNTRTFGGLKPGLGVILQLDHSTELSKLQVTSNSSGWAASVYAADSPRDSLAEWGTPVDTQSGLGSQATFDLHQTTGAAVLLWFTDLGSNNKLSIQDISLTS